MSGKWQETSSDSLFETLEDAFVAIVSGGIAIGTTVENTETGEKDHLHYNGWTEKVGDKIADGDFDTK